MKNARVRQYGKTITDLATKLDVPEKYEKALTAALGESIDLLVLPEDRLELGLLTQIAAEVTEKVALIGLKGITQAKEPDAPSGEGIIGRAAELVRSPEAMSALVQRLLSQYLVVDTLERVFSLPEQIRERYNIVTLHGEVLLRSGVFVLGKQKTTSKVAYVRTRNELEQNLKELDTKLSQAIEKEKEARQKLIGADAEIATNQNQQRAKEKQISDMRRELNSALVNLDKAINRRKWTQNQTNENEQEIARLQAEHIRLGEKLPKSKTRAESRLTRSTSLRTPWTRRS
jgi:Chromosome segregation ATPases